MSLTSSSSLSREMVPCFSCQLNPNPTTELDTKFNRLGISESFCSYLKERFSDSFQDLNSLLECISCNPLNATDDPLIDPSKYETIDSIRLAKILCGVAGYDCGKKQLQQLVAELQPQGIKLKFIQPKTITPDQDEYALMSSFSLANFTHTVYISVQTDAPMPNPKGRAICMYNYSENKVERKILDERLDFTDIPFEGYKCGHELSHAIAFVRFYNSLDVQVKNNINNLWSGQHNIWTFLPKENNLQEKVWEMFNRAEEYRNVLGLGLKKIFEDSDRIIGEFDYLNELMKKKAGANSNVIYIRMPYNENYWYEDIALDLCRKKYYQLYPELLHEQKKSSCIIQ